MADWWRHHAAVRSPRNYLIYIGLNNNKQGATRSVGKSYIERECGPSLIAASRRRGIAISVVDGSP
jgi:hypothetical protein